MTTSIQPETRTSTPADRKFALWALGFRPFYLLASIYGALAILWWAAQYAGWLPMMAGGMAWHAHEMLFGFTSAVIAGFLLTAVRNWTGQPTPAGDALIAIALLWVASRVAVLTPFAWLSAIVNAAFFAAVAIGIGMPIVRTRNRRNYFFIAVMLALGLASSAIQLGARLGYALAPALGVRLMLDVVLFVLAVMGGRVIPMFTNNGVPGTNARRTPILEKLSLGSVLAIIALDAAGVDGAPLAALLAAAAACHAARWWLWQPWRTLRVPLVWVLHAGYLWIPVHLALRALAELGAVAPPIATHALSAGAISTMIVGMITRTAKGHTGRPLKAQPLDVACYALVIVAGVLRVFGPLAAPAHYAGWILVSAATWSAGFALYTLGYWPVLSRARLDGKPG